MLSGKLIHPLQQSPVRGILSSWLDILNAIPVAKQWLFMIANKIVDNCSKQKRIHSLLAEYQASFSFTIITQNCTTMSEKKYVSEAV